MSVNTDATRVDAARAFVERVTARKRGELAVLKRNAGNTLAEAHGAAWFYQLLDDEGWRNPEIHFLVATLIGWNTKTASTGNLGHTMAVLKARASAESIERRFRILLDADFDRQEGGKPGGGEMAFRLRQLVKLAASKEVGVDWARLLVDLCDWQSPAKKVQRAWAKAFYAPDDRTGADAITMEPIETNETKETSHVS